MFGSKKLLKSNFILSLTKIWREIKFSFNRVILPNRVADGDRRCCGCSSSISFQCELQHQQQSWFIG